MSLFDAKDRKRLGRTTKPSSNELSTVVAQKSRAYRLGSGSNSLEEDTIVGSYAKYFSRSYSAVALDYDGTIVSMVNRNAKPSADIIQQLGVLLDNGIPVLVISGRGSSLLKLKPQLSRFDQGLLFFAMYNGSEIVQGFSGKRIVDKRAKRTNLINTFRSLNENVLIRKLVSRLSLGRYSIEVVPRRRTRLFNDALCKHLGNLLPRNLVARSSGYALDIYPVSRTKDACLDYVNIVLGGNLRFLRIGDQGHEFGNDYELLNSVGGFSVGTISTNLRTCFPVLDLKGVVIRGTRGVVHLLTRTFKVI